MKIKKEIIQAVKEEIETMPEKYIFIALLWHRERFTVVDISNILNIPEEIVDIRIDKVESLIQSKIGEKRGIYMTRISMIVSNAFDLIFNDYEMSAEATSRIHANIISRCLSLIMSI